MELSATDCKRVIEDDSPAASLALDKLKAKAAQNGFNAIHSITVESKGAAALLSNCWSQIKASGIAYNKQLPTQCDVQGSVANGASLPHRM